MTRLLILRAAALFCLPLVTACEPDPPVPGTGAADTFLAEAFCNVQGLAPSLRHTFVVLDENVLTPTQNAEEFVARNPWVRDAVLSLADPQRALEGGAAEPRERITIVRLPENGSAGTKVFTGCLPAMSAQEIAEARAGGSRFGDFFTGGVNEEMEEQQSQFRTRLVAALQAAARAAQGEAGAAPATVEQASLFQAMKASPGLFDPGQTVPRFVIVTDLSRARGMEAASSEEGRRAGFVTGQRLGLNLRGSDVVLLQRTGAPPAQRAFLDAFFLAQQGRLVWAGNGRVSGLPAAPRSVRRFTGQVDYPDGPEAVLIRIGIDATGRLAGSWITLRDQHDRSVPLDGQAQCRAPGECIIRSTNDGLGQTWSLAPGGEPEFANDIPFGGMRNFEMQMERDRLTGRIFDPLINQIGSAPGVASLRLTGVPSNN